MDNNIKLLLGITDPNLTIDPKYQYTSYIEEKIINKKNELNQFILNNKEYTILDLLNLQKKYTNNNNIFNLKKTRKLNYNINGVVLDNLIPKQ